MKTLFSRASLALARRAGRNALTLLAVVLSAATLAALLGITASSAAQTARRFTRMETSILQVSMPASAWRIPEKDLLGRIANFEHIEAAGTLGLPEDSSSSVAVTLPRWGTHLSTAVSVATTAGLAARGAHIVAGHGLAQGSAAASDPYQVLLGTRAASQLGITMAQGPQHITLNGIDLVVSGIVADSETQATLATAVIINPETAARLELLPTGRTLLLRVNENAANAVGTNLAVALNPVSPNDVAIKYPANPVKLRNNLLADSHSLTLITAAIVGVVSAFSIVNTMQIAIVERRKEIGIDMALGLSSHTLALQFLVESMLLGALGACVGTLMGAVATGGAAILNGWPFILPPSTLLIPIFGLVVGALAGVIPAIRAARINPVELLRSA